MLKTLVLGSLLGGNNIGDRGAIAIAEALKTNVALQELYLSDGLIRDEGAMALAEGLKVNGVRSLYSHTPAKNSPAPRSVHPFLATSLLGAEDSVAHGQLHWRGGCSRHRRGTSREAECYHAPKPIPQQHPGRALGRSS